MALRARIASGTVDGRRLRSAHDVERDGLVRVAAEASHFEIKVTSIEGIAERRRRLRRTAIAEHARVPRFAGKAVGFLAGSGGSLSRGPDGRAEHALARFGAHGGRMRQPCGRRQAATACGWQGNARYSTRLIAGCFRFFTLTQYFDRPAW